MLEKKTKSYARVHVSVLAFVAIAKSYLSGSGL